jgi:hypothetical protein
MPSPRVPVFETICKAWIDAVRAIRAVPIVVGIAFLLYALTALCASSAAVMIFTNSGRSVAEWLASPAGVFYAILKTSIEIALQAPLAIALQRHVIRGEVATRYPLNPLRPSYLRYVGTVLALNFAFRVPEIIAIPLVDAGLPYVVRVGVAYLLYAWMIAVLIVVVRKVALFPAIAVYAANATWRAFAPAGAGNSWRIALVLIGTTLPRAIGFVAVEFLMPRPDWPYGTGRLILILAAGLVQLPVLCALAAAAARIHLAIGTPAAPAYAAVKPAIL